MSPALLLVDDEPQLIRALTPSLTAHGYEVESVGSGAAALSVLAARSFDAVILDLGLPDMDGKEVISKLREWSPVPVIVLSARGLEEEKVNALDLGADDFVEKPFPVRELMARIRAALRGRERRLQGQGRLVAGDLTIDLHNHRALLAGEDVQLTRREYDFLLVLARNPDRAVSHKQIIAAVWGADSAAEAQSVRGLAAQLRQKVEADPSRPRLVLTAPGLGYRLGPTRTTP
jgi:two-component system, OmpR family, KDP operon response regulator KdpE